MAHSCKAFLENHGVKGGTTLQDRAGDGAEHHFLHSPLRLLLSDRGWFRVTSPVTYYGAKHHGADLSCSVSRVPL